MKLLGSTLLALTQASHFRAGTFQFTPDNTNIDIKVGFNFVIINISLVGQSESEIKTDKSVLMHGEEPRTVTKLTVVVTTNTLLIKPRPPMLVSRPVPQTVVTTAVTSMPTTLLPISKTLYP